MWVKVVGITDVVGVVHTLVCHAESGDEAKSNFDWAWHERIWGFDAYQSLTEASEAYVV